MFCARRPGLLLSTMRALDNLGLDIQQAVISCFNGFAMDIFRAEADFLSLLDNAKISHIKSLIFVITNLLRAKDILPTASFLAKSAAAYNIATHAIPYQQTAFACIITSRQGSASQDSDSSCSQSRLCCSFSCSSYSADTRCNASLLLRVIARSDTESTCV